tara:strand:+ start:548 stop:898 length:351 start_codon:yes stop_codon:yes gene_type:complete
MADTKKKAINAVLFRNAVPEGSNMPLYKGVLEVDRDFVTDITMSDEDITIWTAKVKKEGKFILPQDLKLETAFWSKTSRNGNSFLSGSIQNPYKKPELPAEEVAKKLEEVSDDVPF